MINILIIDSKESDFEEIQTNVALALASQAEELSFRHERFVHQGLEVIRESPDKWDLILIDASQTSKNRDADLTTSNYHFLVQQEEAIKEAKSRHCQLIIYASNEVEALTIGKLHLHRANIYGSDRPSIELPTQIVPRNNGSLEAAILQLMEMRRSPDNNNLEKIEDLQQGLYRLERKIFSLGDSTGVPPLAQQVANAEKLSRVAEKDLDRLTANFVDLNDAVEEVGDRVSRLEEWRNGFQAVRRWWWSNDGSGVANKWVERGIIAGIGVAIAKLIGMLTGD